MKATLKQSLAKMKHAVINLSGVKKDWRSVFGKLHDSAFAREVDRFGREHRTLQNHWEH